MKVYKHHRTEQPLKWLVALFLFCLVLGWAMTDVYGGQITSGNQADASGNAQNQTVPPQRNPSSVPEPTTLALLALGIGGVVAYRKLKK